MEYKIEDIDKKFDAEVLQNLGNSEFVVKIKGKERNLKILNITSKGIEFILDQSYHFVKYLEDSTAKMRVVVDGVPITLNRHHQLNEIVYKNVGGSGSEGDSQLYLKSQIPGKVVSVNVKEGDKVKKGDVICVLESMKMQVSIKGHKDGTVKKLKLKKGASVAKNDILAEIE
ncbi:MAG: acetyl-CoA carboxylase biotin carboxyl carrier protein subunit [Nitrosopumilaceae archaeon]|nr:MAG: Biotin/lipoyl attachment domain-containing protein [Nitrosopumilales archaeon]